jgi:hypothetical protein
MAMMEQRATAELARVRHELQQGIDERDQALRAKDGEARQLQDLAGKQKQELDRLANENAILKQGVRIQAATVERARAEQQQTEEQRTMLAAAAEHIRTLEAANHGLRVQLEQMQAHGGSMLSPSRWGESH